MRITGRITRTILLNLCIILPVTRVGWAATTRWTGGGGDGSWDNSANWSNGVPTTTIDADVGPVDNNIRLQLISGTTMQAAHLTLGGSMETFCQLSGTSLQTDWLTVYPSSSLQTSFLFPIGTALHLEGDSNSKISSVIGSPSPGSNNFSVTGSGWITAANTYTGITTVQDGTLIVDGSIGSSSAVKIMANGTFSAQPGDRIGSTKTLELLGGTYLGGSDTVGTVQITSGFCRFGGIGNVVATTFARTAGSTLWFTSTSRLRATRLPTMFGDSSSATRLRILPWATGANASTGEEAFATYAGSPLGYRSLETGETTSTFDPGANVKVSGAQALNADVNINSLTLKGAALTLSSAAQLTVGSGGVLMLPGAGGSRSISGVGSLHFPAEAIFHVLNSDVNAGQSWSPSGSPIRYDVNVPMTASSLTKSGYGVLALSQPSSIPGDINVNAGTLVAGAPGALGSGSGTIYVRGGTLAFAGASTAVNRPVVFDYIDIYSESKLDVAAGITATLTGPITQTGDVTQTGTGTLRLVGSAASTGLYYLGVVNGSMLIDGYYDSPQGVWASTNAGAHCWLGGVGTFTGRLQAGDSTVSPGDLGPSIGQLTVGILNAIGSAGLRFDIAGTDPGTGYDQLVALNGTDLRNLSFDHTTISLNVMSPQPIGQTFTLVDDRFSGPVSGIITDLPERSIFSAGGQQWLLSYVGGDGNDITVTVVPEPGSAVLLAAGAIALCSHRRGRRSIGDQ